MIDTPGYDAPLLVRGDPRRPGDVVPRRYLEALAGASLVDAGSGRLHLAEQIASPTNPLTARVAVNRVWHYLFGRGITAAVDNFGKLGTPPTHPELLDHLAAKFVEEGWSLKRIIRYVLLSRAYRLASTPTAEAAARDPDDKLRTHARLRRLEAETIRDALLFVAGRLEFEPADGEGFDVGTPPQEQTRRSVFVKVCRNALSPFLETFDAPKPFTTLGARDETNVPGQALTMLNDPLVIETARFAARRAIAESPADEAARIGRTYEVAFGRPATDDELAAARSFVDELVRFHGVSPAERLRHERVWQDFCHALFNMKEFIYVR